MRSVVSTVWHASLEKINHSKALARFYRWLRLGSQFLEEVSPEISSRGGFAHDLGWLEDLGFDPDSRG